jgi:hypothetical protein
MPFKSEAQRKFMNANKGSMLKKGVDVDDWNQASKGKSLPEHAAKPGSMVSKKPF